MQITQKIVNDYWVKKLSKFEMVETIAVSITDESRQSFELKTNDNIFSAIQTISKGKSLSEYTLLISLFSLVLEKYFQTGDVYVSSPTIQDNDIGSDALLFGFRNPQDFTLREYIRECRIEIQDTLAYRDYDHTLFDALALKGINYHHIVSPFSFSYSKINLDANDILGSLLHFNVTNGGDGDNVIRIHYETSVFTGTLVKQMAGHFIKLLHDFVAGLDIKTESISLLSDAETNLILKEYSGLSTGNYINQQGLVDIFLTHLATHSFKPAVIYENVTLTYGELDRQSSKLANYLQKEMGINSGDFIGVLMDYSESSIISFLAILKTGGIYVPLDSSLPTGRLQYVIEDSKCKAIILHSDFIEKVILFNIPLFNIDIQLDELPEQYSYSYCSQSSESPAYLMYTSGSTGRPKGVLVKQQGIIRMVRHTNYIHVQSDERILGLSNYAFDGSTFDIWATLLNGGTLVLCRKEKFLDLDNFKTLLTNYKIDILFITTALFNAIVDRNVLSFQNVRKVLFGGEAVSVKHVNNFYKTFGGGKLIHVYGPTENTTFSTFFPIQALHNGATIPIGRPISYTQCYILNSKLSLQPIEVNGELYVSGSGLATCYLNDSELTTKRFIAHPFIKGEKLYKTGDICKWLPDGNIVFIGRIDNQVKIRGHRIEIDEIQGAIEAYEGIDEAVIIVKNEGAEKCLTCFFVSDVSIDVANLRVDLQESLPTYMIPSHFVQIKSIPLNRNGKIDKNVLVEYKEYDLKPSQQILPRTETEIKLHKIWKDLLGKDSICITDVFFDIGGHSLNATQLVFRIQRDMECKIELRDIFEHHSIGMLATLIDNQIIEEQVSAIPIAPASTYYRLSSSQHRLWILSQIEESKQAYNMHGAYYLSGSLDKISFEHSLRTLISRHEILRTVFKDNESGEIRQYILPVESFVFSLPIHDLRLNTDREQLAEQYIQAEIVFEFDLEQGPLIRTGLLQLDDNRWVFSFTMHHIISDGWSMGVIIREILSLYHSYSNGHADPLPALRIQYKDYAAWQQAQLSGDNLEQHACYWLNQFGEEIPVLEIPTDYKRPAIKTYNGSRIGRKLTFSNAPAFKQLCQEHGSTLFMGLLGAVNVLLYRYSGQEDIVIGSPIAGRDHADLEDQIGFYVNTLAMRSRFSGKGSYIDLLSSIRQTTLDAYEHQIYPFDELVGNLKLRRDQSRSALFDVVVVLQNSDVNSEKKNIAKVGDLKISEYEGGKQVVSQFDLSFGFTESESDLYISIEYNSDLYNRESVAQMADHLDRLMDSIITLPSTPLYTLNYLSDKETQQLLHEFNRLACGYPKDKTIIDLIELQSTLKPDNIAVSNENEELSYKELNESANRLAHYLRKQYNIKRDDLIGIKLERSEKMIIAMLAVLKSGGAYVPIDLNYPQERIDYIVNDSACKVVIDASELEKFVADKTNYSNENPSKVNEPGDLAYVIYTSGTTGTPKGTLIEHKNVVRLFKNDTRLFDFSDRDVWTMFHSYCFDFSVWEMYGALFYGGKLVIVPSITSKDPKAFLTLLKDKKVTVLNQTPSSFYNIIKEELEINEKNLSLRYVIFGGEALSVQKLENWKSRYPTIKLINMYGITETTVHVTYKEITESEIKAGISNIGKPIPTLQCYVLDAYQNLLPVGVDGELYVGGDGLARGYLNRVELTKEKFIENPFTKGERLYRSGDKVKLLVNGDMEYMGRIDEQVKIRGYRIELGEIEQVLLQHESIKEAVVITKADKEGEKKLVAYIIGREDFHVAGLRAYLLTKLPEYMLPGHYVQVESIPLTSNGKLDKRSLPDPQDISMSTGVLYVAPNNETEEKLVQIWEEILQKEKIGINDNFFELGGHSLNVIQIVSRISNVFQVKINIQSIFKDPTIKNLSEQILFILSQAEQKKNKQDLTEIEL